MLFDPRPKTSRDSLYDREEELDKLLNGLRRCDPLILILGLRRTGKSSLLAVGLREFEGPHAIVDCRVFEERANISYSEFVEAFLSSVNSVARKAEGLRSYLSRVRGLRLAGIEMELSQDEKPRLSEILDRIDEWSERSGLCTVIAFDEAQELLKVRGVNLLPVIAYAYDNLRHISLVLTGSQVGLLHRFLRLREPGSPLYGRAALEVRLGNFTQEQSLDFLRRGFSEHDMSPDEGFLRRAVELLDGVPGWLTLLGYRAVTQGLKEEVLRSVLEDASRLVEEEFERFLLLRPAARSRYISVLRAVADGFANWSSLKRYLEVAEGRRLSDSVVARIIGNLLDSGFLERSGERYLLADPVLGYAVRRMRR